MNKKKQNKQIQKDPLIIKIKALYQNYGIDTSDMEDAELERLRDYYLLNKKKLNEDLKKSEEFTDKFGEDII